MNLIHRAAFKPSRPRVRCLSVSARRCASAMPTLRSRPGRLPFVAVAKAVGNSDVGTVYALRNQPWHSPPAQSAPALERHRGQVLVSQWALPLSEGRRSRRAAVPRGSGVGSVQAVPRFSTVVTPNPSFKRTRSGKPLNSIVRPLISQLLQINSAAFIEGCCWHGNISPA